MSCAKIRYLYTKYTLTFSSPDFFCSENTADTSFKCAQYSACESPVKIILLAEFNGFLFENKNLRRRSFLNIY